MKIAVHPPEQLTLMGGKKERNHEQSHLAVDILQNIYFHVFKTSYLKNRVLK
jgi:hypothetical protein